MIVNNKKTLTKNIKSGKKNSAIIKSLMLGVVSFSAYTILFIYEEWVIQNFSKGGCYAALPIITALIFSLIHGTFSSNLIYNLGLKEKNWNSK